MLGVVVVVEMDFETSHQLRGVFVSGISLVTRVTVAGFHQQTVLNVNVQGVLRGYCVLFEVREDLLDELRMLNEW